MYDFRQSSEVCETLISLPEAVEALVLATIQNMSTFKHIKVSYSFISCSLLQDFTYAVFEIAKIYQNEINQDGRKSRDIFLAHRFQTNHV